jgi:hypothetical protein
MWDLKKASGRNIPACHIDTFVLIDETRNGRDPRKKPLSRCELLCQNNRGKKEALRRPLLEERRKL